MKILILGGTGAMGIPLVNILLQSSKDTTITVTSRSRRTSHNNRLRYVVGNARDNEFLNEILFRGKYDVIVDFMNYDLDEFRNRIDILLFSTEHYIWFSSCRVYADSNNRLTENSERLLETTNDLEFLATNRYALRKARQEDILNHSGRSNFTIIRPYITYNTHRLQLGILEKEQWLYRLMKGKDLVISKEMLEKKTTLTFGEDVSKAVAELILQNNPKGEIFQIASPEAITWKEILQLYVDILHKEMDISPKIYSSNHINAIEMLWEGGYNTKYDRNFNRSFNSAKIEEELNHRINYTPTIEGLSKCLSQFIVSSRQFLQINPEYEAYQDILCDEESDRSYFNLDSEYETYQNYRNRKISEITGLENVKAQII